MLLGQIQSWYWFSEHGLMVYSMLRNRFCERIGREHKSNHSMLSVEISGFIFFSRRFGTLTN